MKKERYIVFDRAGFYHASYNTALDRAYEYAVYTANFIKGVVYAQTVSGDMSEVYDSEKRKYLKTSLGVLREIENVNIAIERAEIQDDPEELSYLYDELSELKREYKIAKENEEEDDFLAEQNE